jgi:predicted NUDIX family NTP pyrophosphohydrolase
MGDVPTAENAASTSGKEIVRLVDEFFEETGFVPQGKFLELSSITQSGGKIVIAWAVEGDCDPSRLTSNLCQVEWPPRSGRLVEFPEVDRGDWFSIPAAR